MAVVEVVARIGDSIIAIARGPEIRVGDAADADIYAPAPVVCCSTPTSFVAGIVTIDVRPATVGERLPRERMDRRAAGYIGISLLVHLALWGTAMTTKSGVEAPQRPRYGHVAPGRAPASPTSTDAPDEGDAMPGIAMALDDRPTRGPAPTGEVNGTMGAVADRGDRRANAIEAARTAGILGSDAMQGDALDDLAGNPASGFDGSGVNGAARGETRGFGATLICQGDDCGQAAHFSGRSDTIKTGTGYGTICGDDKPCRYGTYGRGVYDTIRTHVATAPTVHICGKPDVPMSRCVKVVGEMSKEIIRRYIRRKLPAIQHCYEKALLANATLVGTIETSFVIGPTGRPHDVTTTGMDTSVAPCVSAVIESIQFPLSDGGGSTEVHYPFSFSLAGS